MELNSLGLYGCKINRVNNDTKTNKSVNFKGCDVVSFSEGAKGKIEIIKDLKNINLPPKEITEMMNKYLSNERYDELTVGDKDGNIAHWVDVERNLTPSEAIVYQAFDMDDYYAQYYDIMPSDYVEGDIEAQNRELNSFEFLPLDLAKYMTQGLDIALSGMVLKGEISKEDAFKIIDKILIN